MQDQELLQTLKALMKTERKGQAEFLFHLAEVDIRQLYLPEGFPSLFAYCTQVLGLSESSSAKRIQVVRLSRRFPQVLELMREGKPAPKRSNPSLRLWAMRKSAANKNFIGILITYFGAFLQS